MKDSLRRTALVLHFIAFATITNAQQYILPNEVVLFSFTTQKGKFVSLNKDKSDKYLVYRFGTKDKIEFQYPSNLSESWKSFKYSFYFRGGGAQNEGLDLNAITFFNKNFRYEIFDNYFAVGNIKEIGINVIDTTTKRTIIIKGVLKSRKGTMTDFRENGLLEFDEDLYD